MRKTLRRRGMVIVSVLVVCLAVGVYPLLAEYFGIYAPSWLMQKGLKLGLDLKGGVQFVLRVRTDDALRMETQTDLEQLRQRLQGQGIQLAVLNAPDATHISVSGLASQQEATLQQVATEALPSFELSAGTNGSYTFSMKPSVQADLRADAMARTRETIERRINELGVTEATIAQQGSDNDEILVQLPGVTDVARAKAIIQSVGLLELKIVEQGPAPTSDALTNGNPIPAGMEIIPGLGGSEAAEPTRYYLVKSVAAVSGLDLRSARPSLDENGQPAVSFTLTSEGGRKFGTVTRENIGRLLAIVLDGHVQSYARIENTITTSGSIAGGLTTEEAQNLALILRAGALPAGLDYLAQHTIGATLGADSIRSGILAAVVGLLLIVAFMLTYYRLSGVNAVIALLLNLTILLGLMAYIGAVMTLPGIAGFVLTMGMGVDSNVLIFERIKEELEADPGVQRAITAGFSRVFVTLLDTHVAALISAAFLFQFGTGAIRGFAVTLSLGLLSNLFTSTFVSRWLFEMALARRPRAKGLSI